MACLVAFSHKIKHFGLYYSLNIACFFMVIFSIIVLLLQHDYPFWGRIILLIVVILFVGCSKAKPEEVRNVEDAFESLNIDESESAPVEPKQESMLIDIKWEYAVIPGNVTIFSVVNTGEYLLPLVLRKSLGFLVNLE